jgi:hypothetical protein
MTIADASGSDAEDHPGVAVSQHEQGWPPVWRALTWELMGLAPRSDGESPSS